jgi:hypothetical protein
MKALKNIIATALLLFGLLGSVIAAHAIIDPVGAKMADDSDPFGPPATLTASLTLLGVFMVVAAAGVCLLLRRRSHENH